MRDYYEQLWQRLPDSLQPPELNARAHLLTNELTHGDRVLDLGCGEGTFTQLAQDSGAAHVLGVEVAQARSTAPSEPTQTSLSSSSPSTAPCRSPTRALT